MSPDSGATQGAFSIAEQDVAPGELPQEVWQQLSPGARLRLLHRAGVHMHLTAEEYRRLQMVPYWAFYGPEDGAPADWFNQRGYLLPKYQPAGAEFGVFRQWRRRVRAARWKAHLRAVRWKPIYDRVKVLEPFLYFGALITLQLWLRSDPRPSPVVVWSVFCLLVGFGLFLRFARRWLPWLGY